MSLVQTYNNAFQGHLSEWTFKASRVASIIAAFLILSGWILEWVLHPDKICLFFYFRVVAAVVALSVLPFTYFKQFRRYGKILFLFPILIVSICIQAMMLFLEEGYGSTYYAGLNLCILGFAITVTLSVVEVIFSCVVVVGMWIVGVFIGDRSFEFAIFFNNLFFLVGTSLIAIGAVFMRNMVAAREFKVFESRQQLQELDKMKTRFFANVSHELRTPLVALSSVVQMIRGGEIQDMQVQDDLLRNSETALRDMLENVNDLLLKTRSEKAMLDVRWFNIDFEEFVRSSLGVFSPVASKHDNLLHFESRLDEPLHLYIDRFKLKKIINNLVGNALKFTEHGRVTVSVSQTKTHAALVVEDTGKGIPKEEIQDIFKPFVQASNNLMRDVQGTGIGLSLVKDFVKLHRGTIAVESKMGQGSRFTVSFLLGDAHVDMSKIDHSELLEQSDIHIRAGIKSFEDIDLRPFAKHEVGKPNLLLVEDNPHIVQVLGYVLRDRYNLYFAKDGQEGLEKAREFSPDLIVSDVMMPRKNGYELTKEIKSDPLLMQIPVILLTSKSDQQSRLQGFKQGADEYLFKPFNNQEILVRVQNLLDKRSMEMELIRSEKLRSAGVLASGVSHEINNPLAYIMASAEKIIRVFSKVQEEKMTAEKGIQILEQAAVRIKEGVNIASSITKALQGFVRQGTGGFHLHDIHTGMDATLMILHANYKGTIDFQIEYELKELVECNLNSLNQVWMNLLQNAIHAVEHVKEPKIVIRTFQKDSFAHVVIEDNGCGISKENLNRIFDLLFTTKPLGRGTGMGMYISRQIIKEHDGILEVDSLENQGTICRVCLPLKRGKETRKLNDAMKAAVT